MLYEVITEIYFTKTEADLTGNILEHCFATIAKTRSFDSENIESTSYNFV